MVDIVGINSTNNQVNRVADRSVAKVSSSKGREPDSSSAEVGDRIEISAGAKEASVLTRLVSSAQAEPDVRPEAVSRAKEKLDSGGFNGIEVSRQAAKKILGID